MTAYLYIGHPDWSVHYFTDSRDLPIYGLAFAIAAGAGCMLLTWYIGSLFMQMEKRILAAALLALTGMGVAVCMLTMAERLTEYGSYQSFAENLTLGLMEVKLGYVLVVWLVGTAAAATFVCLELHRDARRARSV